LDNIDPFQLFVRGHVEALMLGGTHYALPSYEGCPTMYYRQDILDELGLSYPEPGWTYQDAEKLWRACTSIKPNYVRHGVSLYTGYEMEYLYKGWGGSEMDPTHTRCLLDSPQCIAAAEWLYDLLFSQVATYRTDSWGLFGAQPTCVFAMSGGWTLLPAAINLGDRVKWDILPMPVWPSGFSATFDNIDFYGILTTTKYPDKAWELLRWITTEPYYTRFMMRVNLTGPALTSLWDEWEGVIRSATPPLRNKNIGAYREAALGGHAYPHLFFLQGPIQADNIITSWQTKIANRQVSVAEGYTQAARQVNAWEQAAGSFFAKQQAEWAAVRKVPVSPTTSYAAPSVAGLGVPYQPTPYIVQKNGQYTLLGDGWDCWEASDNCTFACIPVTATEGEWWCRVVLISNLTCPHLSQWAKVGMMARADLSDDAVEAYTHVTGAHNIEWQVRMIPGETPSSESGWTPDGLNGPALCKPNTQKHNNYLIKPVWLKLSRKGPWWTAWASWDGKTWKQTGTPGLAEMGGCWVGIMACAHNGSFNNQGYIRAVIDNLNFTPTHFVQVGSQGVPPAAGKVPSNWASV
jgi:ABC-type glycerol-3-phosphate transport system substrate-binding protein